MKTRVWILALLSILAVGALIVPIAGAKKKAKHQKHGSAREQSPLVIGHRGASGFLPEHTLQAYKLAIKLGADYIEPDLVATKDGVLIARHEPIIGDSDPATTGDSTNVGDHSEFAGRETTRMLDGVATTGFWASDFTLAEIKTLGARQTRGGRPTEFNGKFKVPTLQEVIDLAQRESKKRHRRIGIYPETKNPTFHQTLNPPLPLEGRLVKVLKRNGLNKRNAPVFVQSFEQANLKQLNSMTPVRLVQLMDANDTDANGNPTFAPPFDRPYDWTVSGRTDFFDFFATNAGLDEVKTYADGIGPWKVYIIPITGGGGGLVFPKEDPQLGLDPDPPTDLVERAHARGLLVHTWTFRDDAFPSGFSGGPVEEYLAFYREDVDGVFSDFPDTAWAARELFRGP